MCWLAATSWPTRSAGPGMSSPDLCSRASAVPAARSEAGHGRGSGGARPACCRSCRCTRRGNARDAPCPRSRSRRLVLHPHRPGPAARAAGSRGPGGPASGRTLEAPLVVAMPATPGATDLPDSQREASYLMAGNPDGRALTGPEATRGAVLSAIPLSTWIHFACHGVQERAQPSRAGCSCTTGRWPSRRSRRAARIRPNSPISRPARPSTLARTYPTGPSPWPRRSSWPGTGM